MATSTVSMMSQIQVDRPETDLSAEFKKAAAGPPQRQDVSFDGITQPQDGHAIGELYVRGNAVINGYFRNEDATKAGNIICSSNQSIHKNLLRILKPVVK